jgi:hypothetical protein
MIHSLLKTLMLVYQKFNSILSRGLLTFTSIKSKMEDLNSKETLPGVENVGLGGGGGGASKIVELKWLEIK